MAEEVGFDMAPLYKAVSENNWPAVKEFIDHHPRVLNLELVVSTGLTPLHASTGDTPLHVAVKYGDLNMVQELVRLVSPEYLKIRDAQGYTPLGIAASHRGIIPIAKCLVDKNMEPLHYLNGVIRLIPVTLAFHVGHNEMGRYLYSVTPLDAFKGQKGASFLRDCFFTGDLDIALDLLQKCEELIFAADYDGYSTIEHIAFYLSDSLNKSQLKFWQQWVYHYIKIPSTTATNHFCVDMQQEGEMNNKAKGLNLLQWLISLTYNLFGMKEIHKLTLQHTQATEILNLACNNLTFLSEAKKRMIAKALLTAAKLGNAEFFFKVSTANPELISMVTFSREGEHAFFNAVEYRQAEIFNLLRGFHFRNVVAAMLPKNKNNLLHSAAKLAPASQLNRIPGAALQMQREWQWFKAVEDVVNPGTELRLNKEGLTPLDYFKKNHKELRNEGEKWMKDTASSCSIVAALIVTIMFAAAFTVPGGDDQTSGYPIFLKDKLFKVFLISDALSMFAATTSVLTFLGILTSRYAEDDFLYSLPTKLIIGLSALFLSIANMLIAFSATIIIMLAHNSSRLGTFLPVIMLASVPLILFVLLQFPLLVEIISSTYGPDILKKKVKKWS